MSEIPTARSIASGEAEAQRMIEFAKFHVQEALKAAAEKALVEHKCQHYHSGKTMWKDISSEVYITVRNENSYDEHHSVCVDYNSIKNAYPLTNIK